MREMNTTYLFPVNAKTKEEAIKIAEQESKILGRKMKVLRGYKETEFYVTPNDPGYNNLGALVTFVGEDVSKKGCIY